MIAGIADVLGAERDYFLFDSFEGLPEAWGHAAPKTFTTGGAIPAAADPRVSFVKGWFQNTLPDFLAATRLNPDRPVLVHYDADLYTSTLFILTTLCTISQNTTSSLTSSCLKR